MLRETDVPAGTLRRVRPYADGEERLSLSYIFRSSEIEVGLRLCDIEDILQRPV